MFVAQWPSTQAQRIYFSELSRISKASSSKFLHNLEEMFHQYYMMSMIDSIFKYLSWWWVPFILLWETMVYHISYDITWYFNFWDVIIKQFVFFRMVSRDSLRILDGESLCMLWSIGCYAAKKFIRWKRYPHT